MTMIIVVVIWKKIPNPLLLDSVPRNVFAEITACLIKCIEVVDNRTMLSWRMWRQVLSVFRRSILPQPSRCKNKPSRKQAQYTSHKMLPPSEPWTSHEGHNIPSGSGLNIDDLSFASSGKSKKFGLNICSYQFIAWTVEILCPRPHAPPQNT
jgi:hypothetical protein